MKKDPEKDFDERTFYRDEAVQTLSKCQLQFKQTQKKTFREFRLVEILSETEVKEHFGFIHPFYEAERQRLYFDCDNNYMIEKLSHPRVFLYGKEDGKSLGGLLKWKCIRRLHKFPEELENDSGFLRVISPSLQLMLGIDRTMNQFIIRDTFTLTEKYRIPKFLMDLGEEKEHEIMNRFAWVDEQHIKLINKQGIEMILDMDDKYSEVEYNAIPLFDYKDTLKPHRSYYQNRKPLDIV